MLEFQEPEQSALPHSVQVRLFFVIVIHVLITKIVYQNTFLNNNRPQ